MNKSSYTYKEVWCRVP